MFLSTAVRWTALVLLGGVLLAGFASEAHGQKRVFARVEPEALSFDVNVDGTDNIRSQHHLFGRWQARFCGLYGLRRHSGVFE